MSGCPLYDFSFCHRRVRKTCSRVVEVYEGDGLENHLTARVQSTSSKWCHAQRRRHPLLEERWPVPGVGAELGDGRVARSRMETPTALCSAAHRKQGINSYAGSPSEEVSGREYHVQPRVILAPGSFVLRLVRSTAGRREKKVRRDLSVHSKRQVCNTILHA